MKAEGFTIDNSQLAAQRYHTFRSLHPLPNHPLFISPIGGD